MFIRRTKTAARASGEAYHSHRLVASERVGAKVRQRTLLNLGSEFPLPREQWGDLCARIDEILSGQLPLADADPAVESLAQKLAAGLVARGGEPQARKADWREIDVDSLEMLRPRSAGAEQVALEAIGELGLPGILETAGLNGPQRAAAIANIAGRMCEPGSERATLEWLRERSALGELTDFDFEDMSPVQLYRSSDRLVRHKETIESALFSRARDLFELPATVTLYDLTNTFFEGSAAGVPMAKHGRSKERRGDCPLLTLGLCLDESGFVRRSEVLPGNVSEAGTLPGMLSTRPGANASRRGSKQSPPRFPKREARKSATGSPSASGGSRSAAGASGRTTGSISNSTKRANAWRPCAGSSNPNPTGASRTPASTACAPI